MRSQLYIKSLLLLDSSIRNVLRANLIYVGAATSPSELFGLKTIAYVIGAHWGKTSVLHKWVYLDASTQHRLLSGNVICLLVQVAFILRFAVALFLL